MPLSPKTKREIKLHFIQLTSVMGIYILAYSISPIFISGWIGGVLALAITQLITKELKSHAPNQK